MPLGMNPYQEQDFDLAQTVGQAVSGFVEGFTTLDVGSYVGMGKPRNTIEEIARSIGHLAGFAGWIPGVGTAGKVIGGGIGMLAKGLKSAKLARGGIKAAQYGKALDSLSTGVRSFSSVPMAVGNVAERAALKVFNSPAMEGIKFMQTGPVRDALVGFIKLGAAGATSAHPIIDPFGAIDERMAAFVHMGLFGSGQRILSNTIRVGGKIDMSETLGVKPPPPKANYEQYAKWLKSAERANNVVKGISSSIALGLPSTLRGAPLEIQVYEYLLNGFFGYIEPSYAKRRAGELIGKHFRTPEQRIHLNNPEAYLSEVAPEVRLEESVAQELKFQGRLFFGKIMEESEGIEGVVSEVGKQLGFTYADVIRTAKKKDGSPLFDDAAQNALLGSRSIKYEIEQEILKKKQDGEELTPEQEQEIIDRKLNEYLTRDIELKRKSTKSLYGKSLDEFLANPDVENFVDDYNDYGLQEWRSPIRNLADDLAKSQKRNPLEVEREIVEVAKEVIGKDNNYTYDQFLDGLYQKLYEGKVVDNLPKQGEESPAKVETPEAAKKGAIPEEAPAKEDTPKTTLPKNVATIELKNGDIVEPEEFSSLEKKDIARLYDAEGGIVADFDPKPIVSEKIVEEKGLDSLASISKAAGEDKPIMKVRPNISRNAFMNYLMGEDKSPASVQKKAIIPLLRKKGWTQKRISELLDSPEKIKEFLILHEISHISHKDNEVYWKQGNDLLTPDKLEIELRATTEALELFEKGKTDGAYEYRDNTKVYVDLEKGEYSLVKIPDSRDKVFSGKPLVEGEKIGGKTPPQQAISEQKEFINPKAQQLYEAGVPKEHINRLREVYLGTKYRQKMTIMEYDADLGTLRAQKERSKDGSLQRVEGFAPYGQELLEGVEYVNRATKFKGGLEYYKPYDRESPYDFGKVMLKMWERGKSFYGGLKVTDNQIFADSLIDTKLPINEYDKYLSKIGLTIKELREHPVLGKELKSWVKRFSKEEAPLAQRLFITHTANMIEYLELVHQVPIKELMGKKGFLNTVASLTKRNQILFAKEISLAAEPEYFRNIKDVENDQVKFIVLPAINKADYVADPVKDKNGKLLGYKTAIDENQVFKNEHGLYWPSEVIRDGSDFWRWDMFDAKAEYVGVDKEAGFLKGVKRFNNEDSLYIGKSGDHRASPKRNKFLEENGIHLVVFDTTAKAMGNREFSKIRYENGEYIAEDLKVYNMPLSGLTSNLTVKESLHKEPHTFIKQALTNVRDSATIDAVYKKMILPQVRGDKNANALYGSWYEAMKNPVENKKLIADIESKLDVRDLGFEQMVDILFNGVPVAGQKKVMNSKLYQKVMKEIFRDISKDDLGEGVLEQDVIDTFRELSTAPKLLEILDLNPTVVNLPGNAKYVQTALRNYFVNRITKPKMSGSAKVVAISHDVDVEKDYQVKEGEFLANEYLGGLIDIETHTGVKTLREVFDLAQKDKTYEPYLDLLVARSPADSPAGIRVLRFKGFLKGAKGSGTYFHHMDMANLGGADTDGDSFFLYSNVKARGGEDVMPELKEYYKKNKDIWLDEKGNLVEVKTSKQLYDKENENPNLFEKDWSIFSLEALQNVHEYGNQANSWLGLNLNTGNRLYTYARMREGDTDVPVKVYIGKDPGGRSKYLNVKADVAPNFKELEAHIRDIINMSADAADGKKMKNPDQINQILSNFVFKNIKVGKLSFDTIDDLIKSNFFRKKKWQKDAQPRIATKETWAMASADKYLNGRDRQNKRAFSFFEIIEGLNETYQGAPQFPNLWYKAGEELSFIQISSDYSTVFGRNYRDLVKQWNVLHEKVLNYQSNEFSRELLKLLKRHSLSVPDNESILAARDRQTATEMRMQDILDIASALNTYKAIERFVGDKPELYKEASRLLEETANINSLIMPDRKGEATEYVSKTREEDFVKWEESMVEWYKKKAPEEQKLVDAYLLSSWNTSTSFLGRRKNTLIREASAIDAEKPKKIERGVKESDAAAENRKLWREKMDKMSKAKAIEEFMSSSSFNTRALDLGIIKNGSIIDFGKSLDQISLISVKKTSPEMLERVFKDATLENLDMLRTALMNQGKPVEIEPLQIESVRNVERVEKEFIENFGEFAKDAKLETSLASDMRKLKELLHKYPNIINVFPDQFKWITGSRPEVATINDIAKFTRYLESLDKSPLSRVNFFEDPATVGKNAAWLAPRKIKIDNLKVMSQKGLVQEPANVYMGAFDIQYKIADANARSLDNTLKRVDQIWDKDELNTLYRQIEKASYNQGYPHLVEDIQTYVAYSQEKGLTKTNKKLYGIAKRRLVKRYRDKEILLTRNGETSKVKIYDLIKELEDKSTQWWDAVYDRYIKGENKLLKFVPGSDVVDIHASIWDVMQNSIEQKPTEMVGTLDEIMRLAHLEMLNRMEIKINGQKVLLGDINPDKVPETMRIQTSKGLVKVKKRDYSRLPYHQRGYMVRNDIIESIYKTDMDRYSWLKYDSIGRVRGGYWYHTNHDPKLVEDARKKQLGLLYAANKDLGQYYVESKLSEADDVSPAGGLDKVLEAFQSEKFTLDSKRNRESFNKPSFVKSRASEPMPGWDTADIVRKRYLEHTSNAYWRILSSIAQRRIVDSVRRTGTNPEWVRFMENYRKQTLGQPTYFDANIVNDPQYKLKPYYYFTEEAMLNTFKKMKKNYGIKFIIKPENYDENLIKKLESDDTIKRIKREDDYLEYEMKVPVDSKIGRQLFAKYIAHFSTLEGKTQLVTLLTSPKTILNNMFSGNVNTIIDASFKHWKGARNLDELQRINPKWKTWKDVEEDVESLGGLESYYKDMFALGNYKGGAYKAFFEEALQAIKNDPFMKDGDLRRLWRKKGLSDALFDKAGWFMRFAERRVRRRAWIAGYLKAREVLEAGRGEFKWDDPVLIQMANKTVNNTQFIYNSANRPAFTATAVGKIFSRFQLFAFKSIRFRKTVLEEAIESGMRPGSEEVKRMQRLVSADIFMLSLATLFPFSLFEYSLAPPYNTVNDVVDFMFGDEEKKRKAFFGVLPYPANIIQPVLPPSSRYFTGLFSLMNGDYDSFGKVAWTLFPFGRLARDVTRTVESPGFVIEHLTGIPAHKIHAFRNSTIDK